jgi:hypothetical protein
MTSMTTASDGAAAEAVALTELFGREREAVVRQALAAIGRLHGSHYQGAETARRLERLYDHVVFAATRRDLGPIVAYAEGLAGERYASGYALAELQAAFNALEEALWETVVAELPADQVAAALTLVSSIFGVAKDTLACSYVAAVSRTRTQALDVELLAAGAGSA